ncbi:hypothetical protein ACIRQH_19990 [Streptomyces sp. NPDC102279]|uniref:hypothetical protein n=1 Tax=Streptomyces sp. NPDC102279 TaxID=3366153 RepID=UPI003820C185
MKPRNRERQYGSPLGRRRNWISVSPLAVPTVWMATPDGLICLDLIAVELAVNGLRKGWKLTSAEAAYATDLLLQRGVERLTISKLLGPDYRTLRSWFPKDDTPLGEALSRAQVSAEANPTVHKRPGRKPLACCGTYAAAMRHQKRKEPMDEPCRQAKRAADAFYRKHGTYVGFPGVAA